ncbi:MAG: DsbA family oxidoreductase [Bacteroidota bacterium]
MKVEIWSDVMCPFCYIGKRKFEKALEQFPQKDKVEVEWKSFQLNPLMKTDPTKNINQYLSEAKGWTIDYAKKVNESVTECAKEVGLTYNFDNAIVANSFDAHRFSHLAKQHGLQDKAEERLFAAYFTEGKNTADHITLIQLGIDIGLNADEVKKMLNSNVFADDIRRDIFDAQQVGVQGVPFFVIGNRYTVSGAQESDLFLQALNTAWKESAKEYPLPEIAEGGVCTPESC